VVETDPSFEANRWYTPRSGDDGYEASFQDYGVLVAHAHVVYSDPSLASASVEVVAKHKDESVVLTYVIGGSEQKSNKVSLDSSHKGPLSISVRGADGSSIDLEPLDFRWNAAVLSDRQGDFRGGQKGAIVELFGWPHADIEEECKSLADMGYMGVKVFPVHEQIMSTQPMNNFMNPWFFMYQPVSYRLQGRMGTRDDLRNMINSCRSHGVRVYADAVVNHMTGGGNDANPYHRNPDAGCATWPNKTSSMQGGPSPFYTQNFAYTVGKHTGQAPMQEFPAVPYGPLDFHCERTLSSWTDPVSLNAGWLVGLTDLNTERENVRERIADYMTDLIGIGFSGFRVDAAKHIQPDDLVAIFSKLKRNLGGALPSDFFTWLEIILGGEADLLMCNAQSGYNYGSYFTGKLAEAGFTSTEINQIKTWNSGYPKESQKGSDDCSGQNLQRMVIQNDDHDQQNPGSSSRDMGDAGCVLIKGCDVGTHRDFEVKLFTSPNGVRDNNEDYPIRTVLSSYWWGDGEVQGIPDGLSDCSLCKVSCNTCKGMPYQKAHDASSTGYDSGAGMYTRVHRDQQIVNAMRSWVGLGAISADVYAEVPEPLLV
jgi:alpha-amylase